MQISPFFSCRVIYFSKLLVVKIGELAIYIASYQLYSHIPVYVIIIYNKMYYNV